MLTGKHAALGRRCNAPAHQLQECVVLLLLALASGDLLLSMQL